MSLPAQPGGDDIAVLFSNLSHPDHEPFYHDAPSFKTPSSDNTSLDPSTGVKRGLAIRHLSMMALAGIIGPGLLVGSGGALASGGPASLLIGFGVMGLVAFCVLQAVGELATLFPAGSGGSGFIGWAVRFVDPALGAAVGWNYFVIWFAVLSNEYNVICSIMVSWGNQVPLWGYFLLFWTAFLVFQLLGVETFGEAEFWFALVKLVGLVAYFLFSIVYVSGGIRGAPALGVSYWHSPGAFASSGFRGVATVFVFCSTFYAGVEAVAIAAAETRNPRRAVPIAVRQVFWRVLIIYMGSALFFGLTCPSNAPGLVGGESRALKSPMTIALQTAGWDNGVHLINAFIFITCLSAVNSSIYIGSRTLLSLAAPDLRAAPRILAWTDRRGVPIPAVVLTNLCGALSMMNVQTGASEAFAYVVNLSGVSTFLVWGFISLTHLRFRRAWEIQGRGVEELPFRAIGYPWTSWASVAANVFLALVQGWTTLAPFDGGTFVDAYILLPLSGVVFGLYKWLHQTRLVIVEEADLLSGRRRDLDEGQERDEVVGVSWWKSVLKIF